MTLAEKWPREWTKVPDLAFQDIIYEKKYFDNGGVGRISINRPPMNALSDVGMREICTALSDCAHDHSLGVIVLTSVGDTAFCTGGDVKWESLGGLRAQFEQPLSIHRALRTCPQPIIAAVKGWVIGGGNHWTYWCDLTIAADNAKFGQNGPRIGSPADGYSVSYLSKIIGAKKAKEMWMLCRRYTAEEALEWGLINKVVPLEKLDEEVDKWCEEVLTLSPTCLRIVKASFDTEMDDLMYSGYRIQQLISLDYFGSEENMEGPRAFQEKRPPNFGKFRKPRSLGGVL